MARSLRPVPVQPAEDRRQLPAERHGKPGYQQRVAVLLQPAVSGVGGRPICRTPPEASAPRSGRSAAIRIVESWLTDRLHNNGSASSNQILAGTGCFHCRWRHCCHRRWSRTTTRRKSIFSTIQFRSWCSTADTAMCGEMPATRCFLRRDWSVRIGRSCGATSESAE